MQPFGEVKLDAAEIEQREFDTGFRGYDQTSVREYLRKLANTIRSVEHGNANATKVVAQLEDQNHLLEQELAEAREILAQSASPASAGAELEAPLAGFAGLDEDELDRLLGEETTRVLTSARHSGNDIVARAEAKAAAIEEASAKAKANADAEALAIRETAAAEVAELRDAAAADATEARDAAAAEANEKREAAARHAANSKEEASQKATQIVSGAQAEADEVRRTASQDAEAAKSAADDLRANAEKVAEAIRAEAGADSEAAQDAAREHARSMLVEAQSVREKVLSDLVQRRRVARQQLDGAKAARDRLARSLAIVRQQIDEANTELQLSVPEARVVMETIARHENAAEDEQDVANLAKELDEGSPERPVTAKSSSGSASAAGQKATVKKTTVSTGSAAMATPRRAAAIDETSLDAGDVEDPDLSETAGAEAQDLDDIFARIRDESAGEKTEVAPEAPPAPEPQTKSGRRKARRAAARGAAAVVAPASDEPSDSAAAIDLTQDSAATEPESQEPAPPGVFSDRDVTMTKLGPDVRRHIKRTFADDQSDVLDRLRIGKGKPSVDELAPKQKLIVNVIDALTPGLTKAAEQGSQSLGNGKGADVTKLVAEIAAQLVDPFRNKLEAIIERADDDRDEVLEPVRSIYRELRGTTLTEVADDGLASAFALGLYESIASKTAIRWDADPRVAPGAECYDNTLAGAVVKGQPFPTGHTHPLGEPGCRCLVVPDSYAP